MFSTLISKLPPKLKVGRRLHQPIKRLIVCPAARLLTLLSGVGVVATRFFAKRELFAFTHAQWFQVLHAVVAGTRCEIYIFFMKLATHSVRVVSHLLSFAHIIGRRAFSQFTGKVRTCKLFGHTFRRRLENLGTRIVRPSTRGLHERRLCGAQSCRQ